MFGIVYHRLLITHTLAAFGRSINIVDFFVLSEM